MKDKIEIISPEYLNHYRDIVIKFKGLSKLLGHYSIGWSYYLEWAWLFGQFESKDFMDKVVLDAGAGLGLSQWYLAEQGANVISVDVLSRACLPIYYRRRYQVEGIRESDLLPLSKSLNLFEKSASTKEKIINIFRSLKGIKVLSSLENVHGRVLIYNQDLRDLNNIPDSSVDIVISVSSLEHNKPEELKVVINELFRVLKIGRPLVATLVSSKYKDWLHEPSSSWCYSEETLRQVLNFSSNVTSNYSSYDDILNSMKNCEELQKNLSYRYYISGRNAMPWGRWNPEFLPVGIIKYK